MTHLNDRGEAAVPSLRENRALTRLGFLDIQGKLEDTLELAPLADSLGYTRYWLTEFPSQPSPIPLVAVLAGLTERIRVGTAAILFNYYPPKRTAHDFQLLERMFPGRIDAGVCSSTGATHLLVDDLDGRNAEQHHRRYGERFATFLKHLRNTPGNPEYDIELAWLGALADPPLAWSLGHRGGADLAAQHGTAFGYSLMHVSSIDDTAVVEHYRERFQASRQLERPTVVVAVCGVCGETDDDARAMTPEARYFLPKVVGSAATCAAALGELRRRYEADEVIFADMCPDYHARRRSLTLLATAAAAIPDLC